MGSVLEHLTERGVPFLVLPDPLSTRVERTARTHGIEPAELIRSEVVIVSERPMLLVVPWSRVLEWSLAQRVLGDSTVRPATDAEIRAAAPAIEPGAAPPWAELFGAAMVVDPAVMTRSQIAFAAGDPRVVVVMQREDLFRAQTYDVAPLTAESLAEPAIAAARRAILEQDDLLPVHLTGGLAVTVP